MIVAPNSPRDRAQLITSPAASAAPARGIVIARKSCHSDAPSTRAASSRSRSMLAIPVLAERMKNGADTKVWARMTAPVVNGTEIPSRSSAGASSPRRPKTRSSANPATDGGRTIGRSTIASSQPFPRKRRRARTNASGRPSATVTTRLTAVVTRLSASASSTMRDPIAMASEPSKIDRPTRVRTGRPRNSATSAATTPSDRSPWCPGRRTPDPGRSNAGRRRAASSVTRAGGSRARRGSPGRPGRRTSRGTSWRRPRASMPGPRRRCRRSGGWPRPAPRWSRP